MPKIKLHDAGGTTLTVDVATGRIAKLSGDTVYLASADWLATGAVRFQAGRVVERLSLTQLFDLLASDRDALFYKNGKQRWYLTDLDHGTARVQMGPGVVWCQTLNEEQAQ